MSGLIRYALFYEEDGNSILCFHFCFFDASIANGLLKVMVYFWRDCVVLQCTIL